MQWIKHVVDERHPTVDLLLLVMDNLNRRWSAALHDAVPPAAAKRLAMKPEIHHTRELHAWEAQRNRHRATINISRSTRLYHTGAQRPELSAAQLVQDRAVQCCPARRYQRTASPTDTGIAEVLATGGTLSDAQTTFLHLEGG
jgi:hypothetical protein